MVLAIPITVYTALHQQKSVTKAADVPDTTVVAVINGQQITKAQVRQVAEEDNDPSAVDQDALQNALDILEERKILDHAAAQDGITVDQARVDRYTQQGLSDTQAHYEALREQVTLKEVNSREVLSISFWNPPASGIGALDVSDQAVVATELTTGIPALATAETRMKANENVMDIAGVILASSPELAPVLSVNGFIYSTLTDDDSKAVASYPQIYEFGDSPLDDQTRDAIFAQDQGAVVKVSDTDANRGGSVFKIETKGNVSGASSYDQWLTSQKTSLVQSVGSL